MATVKKFFKRLVLVLLWLVWLLTGPYIYFGASISGRVIDPVTRQGVAGAIVTAKWELFFHGLGDSGSTGTFLNANEAVTDSQGYFRIPGWGPRLAAPLTELDSKEPYLIVYKMGYAPRILKNKHDRHGPLSVSDWDGEEVTLSKFSGSNDDYALRIAMLTSVMHLAPASTYDWMKFPHLIVALLQTTTRIEDFVASSDRRSGLLRENDLHGSVQEIRDYLARYRK